MGPLLLGKVLWLLVFVDDERKGLSQVVSKVPMKQSMARGRKIYLIRKVRLFMLSPKYFLLSEIIVTKDARSLLLPDVLRVVAEAIANHLVYEFSGQEICPGLSRHRTEFDDIHSNDSGTAANLVEEVE